MSTASNLPDEPTGDMTDGGRDVSRDIETAADAVRPSHAPAPRVGEAPGDMIGAYRLLEVIGEGGFGVVWLAERREPMVQRVALKVIKPGMDSKAVVARFEQERQALAVMDHPNVARVLDGGVTPTGRPYFVMEHVKGEPITAFADRSRLTIRERLELFVPVCEAVQHAHMKGIIHRDIKPSNILAASAGEGRPPVVKVIDFGVAKAISQTLTDKTIFTERGQIIGTPEYMSPEQAEMGATDIDTRTDVYSLGVVLYELLSGTLPFDAKTLRSAGYAEIQRIIREVDAPRPSTKLSTADDQTGAEIARYRQADRERIAGELRRELEWIPMKALRKDRARRYASAESLAADVRRYLDGRPLEAAPESRVYLARKFVRRNRVPVVAAGAVALALVAGVVATSLALERALAAEAGLKTQLAETETAQRAEKERADQLKKVSDFQSEMLKDIDTTKAGVELTRDMLERFAASAARSDEPEADRMTRTESFRSMLVRVNATDAAAAMIDRTILKPAVKAIDERFKDDPSTDASLRQSLAELYFRIGLYAVAQPLQESALATRRRVLGDDDPNTINSMYKAGSLLRTQGKLKEAEPLLREALERARRVLGDEHPDTFSAISAMGRLMSSLGKLNDAEQLQREAVEKSRRVLGEEDPQALKLKHALGVLLTNRGKFEEAGAIYREVLESFRTTLGDDHPDTINALSSVGVSLNGMGRFAEAEPYYREALEKWRKVMGEEHPRTLTTMSNLGVMLDSAGKSEEAESVLREALEKRRRLLGEDDRSSITTLVNLAASLDSQGKRSEAERCYREAYERFRRVSGEEHPDTLVAANGLGQVIHAQGRLGEAEPYYRKTLEAGRRVFGEEHPRTIIHIHNMGALLRTQGKLSEAEPYIREGLEKRRRVLGADHPDVFRSLDEMSMLLRAQGRLAETESCLRECIEARRRVMGAAHPDTLRTVRNLAILLSGQGRFGEAEVNLLEVLEALEVMEPSSRVSGSGQQAMRAEIQGLVDLYTAWDKAEPGKGYDAKAAEWKAKLDATPPSSATSGS